MDYLLKFSSYLYCSNNGNEPKTNRLKIIRPKRTHFINKATCENVWLTKKMELPSARPDEWAKHRESQRIG